MKKSLIFIQQFSIKYVHNKLTAHSYFHFVDLNHIHFHTLPYLFVSSIIKMTNKTTNNTLNMDLNKLTNNREIQTTCNQIISFKQWWFKRNVAWLLSHHFHLVYVLFSHILMQLPMYTFPTVHISFSDCWQLVVHIIITRDNYIRLGQ